MTRKEFLESLERHLRGQLSENQLRGHVEYYRDYIEKEIASGKTEAEVLDMLGDPWLIPGRGVLRKQENTLSRKKTENL